MSSEQHNYAVVRDVHEARQYAAQSRSQIAGLHLVTDRDEAEWEKARSMLHHAVLQYYSEMRPYLVENEINHRGTNQEKQRAKVIGSEEDIEGDAAFYITQLDDFRYSQDVETEVREKVGQPDEEVEVRKPNVLPVEVATRCLDYLDRMYVRFMEVAESQELQRQDRANVADQIDGQGGDNDQ